MVAFSSSLFGAQSGTTEGGGVFLPQVKARIWEREIAQQSREKAYLKHRYGRLTNVVTGICGRTATLFIVKRGGGIVILIDIHYLFKTSHTRRKDAA